MQGFHKIRYWWYNTRKLIQKKKTGAWSGLSILIFRDDRADHPYRIRINYYMVFFVLATLGALIPAGFFLLIERTVESEKTTLLLENRRALLHSVLILNYKNRELIDKIDQQIARMEDSSGFEAYESLKAVPEPVHQDNLFHQGTTPVDTITKNLTEVRQTRQSSLLVLNDRAYHSLKPLWNRMHIHYIMPRGRPLPSGIGYITSTFGLRRNPFNPRAKRLGDYHGGVDLASAPGTPIIASAPGRVIKVVNATVSGYGLYVKIHHGLGYTSLYAHNSSNSVREGDFVEKGQVIARMGATGAATGNHVHYEVSYGSSLPVDPMQYIQIK